MCQVPLTLTRARINKSGARRADDGTAPSADGGGGVARADGGTPKTAAADGCSTEERAFSSRGPQGHRCQGIGCNHITARSRKAEDAGQ